MVQIHLGPPYRRHVVGDVAQLGERCPCKAEVGGSTPLISTTLDQAKDLRCDYSKCCSLKSEYLTGSNLILFACKVLG